MAHEAGRSGRPASLRRVDARFLLPEMPRSAFCFLPEWSAGLREAGIEVVERVDGAAPDLVVAAQDQVGAAMAVGARMVLLEGIPGRRPRTLRLEERRYLPIPELAGPELLVDLAHGRAAASALRRFTSTDSAAAGAKRLVGRTLVRAGALPRIRPVYAVRSSTSTVPALLRHAQDVLGVSVQQWSLLLLRGSDRKRGAFLVHADASPHPSFVLKFSRMRGSREKVDREERGLRLVERTGTVVSRRTPRSMGVFELAGHHASLQTAVMGHPLGRDLKGGRSRRHKLARVEEVVTWLGQVARTTAHRRPKPDEHLAGLVRRQGFDPDTARALTDTAARVPAVFEHGDLTDGNVLVHRGGFTAVDWELARDDGYPLGDLVDLLLSALPLLDGAGTLEAHVSCLTEAFSGASQSADVLFPWVRRTAKLSGVPLPAVPHLVTLCLLELVDTRARLHAAEGRGHDPWPVARRFLQTWLSHPALGPSWPAWSQHHPASP